MPEFHQVSVAFVTGAGSGIGLAVSQRLVADGITRIALSDLTPSHLTVAISSLTTLSPSVSILPLAYDCSSESAVENAISETVEKFGRIDVCFNAAGVGAGPDGPNVIAETRAEDLEAVLGVNLRGVWLCERAEVRQFMRQEWRDVTTGLKLRTRGSIVNAGSLTSHIAIPRLSPYIMSKHAVLGLTKADAVDYAKEGIRINCICPGWIKTNMTLPLHDSPIGSAVIARAPMNRWGMPEEVAYAVSFLLSDKASFMTGTSVEVDGGYKAA